MDPQVKANNRPQRKGRTRTSRVSSQHQVTIPIEVLREAGLTMGDEVKFEATDQGIVITRITSTSKNEWFGILDRINPGFDWHKEREDAWSE
jgi:bifunctional DNA-binding transcriptional regulator/antitoxin component of YhaV-PrlF toxin-antitoxin module